MTPKTAIVVGATGLVGQSLVQQLLAHPEFTCIKTFSRRSLNIEPQSKLQQHVVDFDDLDAWRKDITGDVLFCTLGTTLKQAGSKEKQTKVDLTYPIQIAQAAKSNGVSQAILVSSYGADSTSGSFYLKLKGQLENAFQANGFESLTILRPSVLLGKRSRYRIGESVAAWLLQTFSWLPWARRFRPIAGSQVAKAMIHAALSSPHGVTTRELDELFK